MPWSHRRAGRQLTTVVSSQLYQTLSNYTDVHRRHPSTALTMTAHSYIRLSLVKANLMGRELFSLVNSLISETADLRMSAQA